MKTDYSRLDLSILDCLATVARPLNQILTVDSVRKLALQLARRRAGASPGESADETVKERLQALRRGGKIEFDRACSRWAGIANYDHFQPTAAAGTGIMKLIHGVVFASPMDDVYDGMAHIWVRDAADSYWFSLCRAVGSDLVEVMVLDQRTRVVDDINVTLSSSNMRVKLDPSSANALDGHREYLIEFAPESQSFDVIREALTVIFHGKLGLQLNL